MEIGQVIKIAEDIVRKLPVQSLQENGIIVDRVYENPEAARYFLMFAEWDKISYEEIFSHLDYETAQRTQVYVDIPFCKKFCNFCAIYSVVQRRLEDVYNYVKCLKNEIPMIRKIYFDRGFKADALEIGGGTPTFLPLELLKEIVECLLGELPFLENHEFNFETSPETIIGEEGIEKLKYMKRAGANRMSIGAQSFNAEILRSINRPHNLEDTLEAIKNVKMVGFNRINIDLMVGLYGQTIEDFLYSVQRALEFDIDIIELYTMRYFDTKEFVPMKVQLRDKDAFLSQKELLVARVAADTILREVGYVSHNGRTYERASSPYTFYAAYYEGNFKGLNTVGIGRKCNSNIYPWQYANYRNLEKYESAISEGRLPIACGTFFSEKARAAKLLIGMFQLPQLIDYKSLRDKVPADCTYLFDQVMEKFLSLGLIRAKDAGYEKTVTGFLFIEEMLKQIYDIAVTPFSAVSFFLGKQQVD